MLSEESQLMVSYNLPHAANTFHTQFLNICGFEPTNWATITSSYFGINTVLFKSIENLKGHITSEKTLIKKTWIYVRWFDTLESKLKKKEGRQFC